MAGRDDERAEPSERRTEKVDTSAAAKHRRDDEAAAGARGGR